jgi:hypothetical protein
LVPVHFSGKARNDDAPASERFAMRKATISVLVILSAMLVVGFGPSGKEVEPAGAKVRVGTYDNRAITIAWFHSEHNVFRKIAEEHERAMEAGDKALAKEFEEKAVTFQRRLHFQGFGRAPVGDLLKAVEDQLADVAAAAGVDAIVFECNYFGDEVEVVDITSELVALFDPTPGTLKMVESIVEQEPVPLEELKDDD